MNDRKRTKAQIRAHAEMLQTLQLEAIEVEFRRRTGIIVPTDWEHMEDDHPTARPRTKITIALDADMVRWFRGFGRGYQRRLNGVLRAYMLAIISREIESRDSRDWRGNPI